MTDRATQSVLFPDLSGRPILAAFDQPNQTSDGGLILLKAIDRRLGLTARLAAELGDRRDPSKVTHSREDLIRQRIFALAAGYADGNDASRIGGDPMHKMMVDRDPLSGEDLASQPTLSRFENRPGRRDLFRMGWALATTVIDHHRRRLGRRARRITIDLDPTDDPTHGAQQLSMFNGHYDSWCYLPMLGFLTFDEEPEQHFFTAILRPGNAHATAGARGILSRTISYLRLRFPAAKIRVRLDGGFATPMMFTFLENFGVEYVVGMAGNSILALRAKTLMAEARRRSKASAQSEALFGETRYAAKSWKGSLRRVIIKAEVVRLDGREPRDNERFVVTNLRLAPERLYEVYRERGDSENRIKELHHDLEIDRTSCSSFWANQFRILLTGAAYVLFQELRRRAAGTDLARAQVGRLRIALIKIGARIDQSVRKISLHLAESHPGATAWLRIARGLGAIAT